MIQSTNITIALLRREVRKTWAEGRTLKKKYYKTSENSLQEWEKQKLRESEKVKLRTPLKEQKQGNKVTNEQRGDMRTPFKDNKCLKSKVTSEDIV